MVCKGRISPYLHTLLWLITSRCGIFNTPPHECEICRIEYLRWSSKGLIAGFPTGPKIIARIGFETKLEFGFRPNSTPQNWLVRWALPCTCIHYFSLITSQCVIFNKFGESNREWEGLFSRSQVKIHRVMSFLINNEKLLIFFT